MWVGLIQWVEGLKRTRLQSPEREGILPSDSSCNINSSLALKPADLPHKCQNCMSQFLKINGCVCLYTHVLLVLFLWRTLTNRDIFSEQWQTLLICTYVFAVIHLQNALWETPTQLIKESDASYWLTLAIFRFLLLATNPLRCVPLLHSQLESRAAKTLLVGEPIIQQ